MRILVACEYSGIVRDAFRALGHDAWSCDLLPTEEPGPHYKADAMAIIGQGIHGQPWDMLICHPPCTYLSSSGLHWNRRRPGRAALTEDAIRFAVGLMECDIPHIAMENPIGCLSTRFRKPDQIIQPHQFGEDGSKATCLWLKGLPKLRPTKHIAPRIVDGKPRWANQTDGGQNKLAPSDHRAHDRSKTYPGIAQAMAEQWG